MPDSVYLYCRARLLYLEEPHLESLLSALLQCNLYSVNIALTELTCCVCLRIMSTSMLYKTTAVVLFVSRLNAELICGAGVR